MTAQRVLVVDDEVVSRIVLARVLEVAGFEITQADDVPIAREAIRRHDFDLVVADYLMPSGTGLDLLDETRKQGVPLILVTGFASTDAIADERVAFVDGHLTKPFDSDNLLNEIAQLLERP